MSVAFQVLNAVEVMAKFLFQSSSTGTFWISVKQVDMGLDGCAFPKISDTKVDGWVPELLRKGEMAHRRHKHKNVVFHNAAAELQAKT